jgi:hypothetical protein
MSFFLSIIDYNALTYIMKKCKNKDFVRKMIEVDMTINKLESEQQSFNKLLPLATSSLEIINYKFPFKQSSSLSRDDSSESTFQKFIYFYS